MALRGISIDAASQTIPSPIFTGTVTFPDGSTWTSTGANHITIDTVNLNAAAGPAVTNTVFHGVGADTTATQIILDTFGATPVMRLRNSGGTAASQSAAGNAANTTYGASFYDGSAYIATGSLTFTTTEAQSSGHGGTKAVLNTTAIASASSTATLTLNNPSATGIQFNGYTTAGLLSNDTSGNVATTNTPSITGSITFTTATAGIVLKRGANGLCGTFVANGVTPVTVSNTNVAITDAIIISLNTVGGTVGVQPHVATITGGSGFTVVCTASDTSTYNYAIIKNAA